jgi:nucleotide-binding universal stress UspA family protein
MHDVVVGVDRSDTARRAAETAAELAKAYATNLHIVMCVEPVSSISVGIGSDRFRTDYVSEAEQFLVELSRELGYERVTHSVGHTDPATALCEEAELLDAKTIVVGNRRVQSLSRVLGSIAADVLKKAPCDVLIANTTG